jgi:hypothetical protein
MNYPHRLAIALVALVALGATSSAAAAVRPARATQQLAVLNHTSEAYARPAGGSAPIQRVSRTGPITGEQTVLPVVARHTDPNGAAWLKVLLPGRPNSHTGWITSRSTALRITNWQITVHLSKCDRKRGPGELSRPSRAVTFPAFGHESQ